MLPLRDDNPSSTRPYVTYVLIVLNVAVFLFELTLGKGGLQQFFYENGVVPRHLWDALHHHEVMGLLPLLTSMFMHGGWLHLGGNMLFLWIFGDNVEDRLGHAGYLAFYLLAGIIACFGQAWSEPLSNLPTLGASGAIGGVLGAYIVLYPTARVTTLLLLGFFTTAIEIPAVFFLGIWFVIQSISGVAALGAASAQGGTAFWAHIAGFLAGVAVGFAAAQLKPRVDPSARWYSNRR